MKSRNFKQTSSQQKICVCVIQQEGLVGNIAQHFCQIFWVKSIPLANIRPCSGKHPFMLIELFF